MLADSSGFAMLMDDRQPGAQVQKYPLQRIISSVVIIFKHHFFIVFSRYSLLKLIRSSIGE